MFRQKSVTEMWEAKYEIQVWQEMKLATKGFVCLGVGFELGTKELLQGSKQTI